jgi:ADP-ribose pyrophosphatase YjhB (NUDIX family)
MKEIIINDDNLKIDDIEKVKKKARAILIKDNKILTGVYSDVVMLPGGGVEKDESVDDGLLRELEEETGIKYNIEDFEKSFNVQCYQKDYPTRSGKNVNRLVSTYYYIGEYKGLDNDKLKLTDEEQSVDFKIDFFTKEELLDRLYKESTNPRKPFFDREMEELLKIIEL